MPHGLLGQEVEIALFYVDVAVLRDEAQLEFADWNS